MKASKFGVIGVGGWGERHVKAYQDHASCEVVAICDANRDKLDAIGDEYGIEARFTDFKELVAMDEIEAVSIVTPDFAHADIAIEAIRNSKHVLIEKPLATTVEDCERIGEALGANPVKFMVDFHNRWNPGMLKLKGSIDKGEVGNVLMAYYRLSDTLFVPTKMLPWAGKSTVNWFLASHCLDTLLWLLGDDVKKLYTVSRSRVLKGMGIDTPDFYQSVLEFENGATALLENCWILSNANPSLLDFKLELVGEKGTLYFDGRPHIVEKYTEEGAEFPDTLVLPEIYGKPRGFAIESIQYFADCICEDKEPMVGLEDGLKVTRIIVAMEESARSGEPVALS